MKLDFQLVYEIIDTLDPNLKKALDPKISVSGQKKPYLDSSYENIKLIEKMDPSHLEALLESYPHKDIAFIKERLKKNQTSSHLDQFLNSFIQKLITQSVPTLPYKYTSSFDGARLLKLNATQMKILTHLLGIYDVKIFLRTSIDQKLILEIHNQLNDLEKAFLKSIQKDQEKVAFKKMPLDTWDKTRSSFETMKYLRGLNRLSKAIAKEPLNIREEIILRLPFKDKAQFLSLCTQSDENLIKSMYEELNTALDFFDSQFLKLKHL
jgi:hypothetical protein